MKKLPVKKYVDAIGLSIILFNPAIVFLLTSSFIITIISSITSVIILLFSAPFSNTASVFVINFLVLLSIFVHAEAVFRFGFPEYVIENLYELRNGYYFNKSYLNKKIKDKEYEVLYKTNCQGFRMPSSIDQGKKIDHCDWLFIGDSFTQGAQVEYKDLYTSQIFRDHPNKVIINSGISGFGITEEFNYYKKEGYKLNAKKVILQLCNFNDFMNIKESGNKFSDHLMQYSDLARYILYGIKYKPPGELPLGRWTEPFYPQKKDNEHYNIFFKEKSKKQLQDIQSFKNILEEFNREVKKNGSELLIFLIPTKEQVYPRFLEEVKLAFKISEDEIDLNIPNVLLNNLCDSLNIPFIDLLNGFKNASETVFYEYDEHLNQYGHFLTAKLLQPLLADNSQKNNISLLSDNFLGERYPSCVNGNILFQATRDGNMEIILKDLSSNDEHRLTYNDVDESHPALNLHKSIIAFTEGAASELTTKVALLDLKTLTKRYIDEDKHTFSSIPSFSEDGSYIAYVEWHLDSTINRFSLPQIVISPLDDLKIKNYPVSKNLGETWRPIFVPGKSAVIYIAKKDGNYDIFMTDWESHKTSQLTFTRYDEWDPVASPDGERVLYSAFKEKNWDLFELDLTNKISKRLTKSIGDEWDPQYCENEKTIIFAGEFAFFNCIYQMSVN